MTRFFRALILKASSLGALVKIAKLKFLALKLIAALAYRKFVF